jgi:hypothetical protein
MIPPSHLIQQQDRSCPEQGVYFESNHICLNPDVLALWPEPTDNMFLACYPEKNLVLISPVDNAFFTKVHDASQFFLKQREFWIKLPDNQLNNVSFG